MSFVFFYFSTVCIAFSYLYVSQLEMAYVNIGKFTEARFILNGKNNMIDWLKSNNFSVRACVSNNTIHQ